MGLLIAQMFFFRLHTCSLGSTTSGTKSFSDCSLTSKRVLSTLATIDSRRESCFASSSPSVIIVSKVPVLSLGTRNSYTSHNFCSFKFLSKSLKVFFCESSYGTLTIHHTITGSLSKMLTLSTHKILYLSNCLLYSNHEMGKSLRIIGFNNYCRF